LIDISGPVTKSFEKTDIRTELLMPNTFYPVQTIPINPNDYQKTPAKDIDLYPLSESGVKKNAELNTSDREKIQKKVDEMVFNF
jgi:hypothetical protein